MRQFSNEKLGALHIVVGFIFIDLTHCQIVGAFAGRPLPQDRSVGPETTAIPVGTVFSFSDGGVSLQPYQRGERPSTERHWAELSQKSSSLAVPAFAAFLSNESDQRIVAMTWISTWIDPEGTTHQYISRHDTLLQGGAVFPKHFVGKLIRPYFGSASGPNSKPAHSNYAAAG